jgi:gamma-glutamylaminecyclotransferase
MGWPKFPNIDCGDTVNVFVYGTLKRGFSNHRITEPYLADVICGKVEGVTLWHASPSFPYATKSNAADACVHGEVLALGEIDEVLARLDGLEGVPHHYVREEVEVFCGEETGVIKAWMYLYPGPPREGWCHVGSEWSRDHFRTPCRARSFAE